MFVAHALHELIIMKLVSPINIAASIAALEKSLNQNSNDPAYKLLMKIMELYKSNNCETVHN